MGGVIVVEDAGDVEVLGAATAASALPPPLPTRVVTIQPAASTTTRAIAAPVRMRPTRRARISRVRRGAIGTRGHSFISFFTTGATVATLSRYINV